MKQIKSPQSQSDKKKSSSNISREKLAHLSVDIIG
jgi:hypothetical protein